MCRKEEKGITLIVLVITVIILVILAAITIDFVGDQKLFEGANELVDRSEKQGNEHQEMVDEVRNLYKTNP